MGQAETTHCAVSELSRAVQLSRIKDPRPEAPVNRICRLMLSKDGPILTPRAWEDITLGHQEGKVANGIGIANSERRKQEGERGPSQWAQRNRGGLKCVLGGAWSDRGDASFEDGGGATGQGMQIPLEAGEGKERDSPLGPPERNLTFLTPDPSPVKPVSNFNIKRECSTKPLNFGNFFFVFNIRRGI